LSGSATLHGGIDALLTLGTTVPAGTSKVAFYQIINLPVDAEFLQYQ
jgi:hypothetical protein